ncbi:MAG: polysaccharide deacetylase family protein [Elusimicrobia bacterium]|nr:polysaccharide deacetylase family protein [Elusimicrobiota bacterium]
MTDLGDRSAFPRPAPRRTAGPQARKTLVSLIYHDIQAARHRYSFTIEEFREHLAAIKEAVGGAPAVPGGGPDLSGFALTFDDGHVGWLQAAEALQELQWKAFFFVITSAVGKAGALSRSDVRRLASMGHVFGTHTVDHPYLFSARDYAFILDQWSRSKADLEDALGRKVTSGAVPGGFYNSKVGRAADAAGLKYLFTSEPVVTNWDVGGCRIYGRFSLTNGMSSRKVARIAAGARFEHARQYLGWNLKKAAKSVMMGPYQALRKRLYPS